MRNVTIVISNIDKSLGFEWIAENLNKKKINLSFILLNDKELFFEKYLKERNIPVYRITYKNKWDTLGSIFRLFFLLKKLKTEVAHTNLYEASYIGMIAAKLAGVRKRINSRHHSSIHHMYFKKGILVDKLVNKLATHIIAISENVASVLEKYENVPKRKISIIHYGFKLEIFNNINKTSIDVLKKKYCTELNKPIIGVIARQTEWKGIQYIIPAFKMLLEKYPKAKLILANSIGDYKSEIDILLNCIPNENRTSILFEKDIASLYKIFDIYVHVPIDEHCEAFGQTYIEALAAKVPSIFTPSGIAGFFIKHKKNALVVPFKDSISIYNSFIELIENEQLRQMITTKGSSDVNNLFTIDNMIGKLEKIYLND